MAFVVGGKGGPGRPKGSTSVWGRYTRESVAETFSAIFSMTYKELDVLMASPSCTILQKMVGATCRKAIDEGDISRLRGLIGAVVPPPKEDESNFEEKNEKVLVLDLIPKDVLLKIASKG